MTTDFHSFLRGLGLHPGRIVADGRVRRCKTDHKPRHRNGAYWLATDGAFGWGQDWALHAEAVVWRAEGAAAVATERDQAEQRRHAAEARMARERAIQGAREFYAACAPLLGGHDYLRAKGLDMTGCRGLRIDRDGWLVVPMWRAGDLVSVQRIAADGTKRFWLGAPTSGAFYEIERRGATLTVLCEGLATGLAIFAAAPTARVVVAFNAGNLPRVAEQLTRRGLATVAADNDHATEARIGRNPGIDYAQEAAAILGCDIAVPEGIAGSDWCDLREERLDAMREAQVYGREQRESALRRAVDAEITRAMMRAARMVRAA